MDVSDYNGVLSYMPAELRQVLDAVSAEKKQITSEIRIRANKPLCLTQNGRSISLDYIVSRETVRNVIRLICNQSEYSYSEAINSGFITFGRGYRAGVCGTAVYENGKISSVREITSINIRIPRFIDNAADEILKIIDLSDNLPSLLIASKAGGGKTTVLKALAKKLSERGKRVSVIDERGEMQGFDLGTNTDILSYYKKTDGITVAVRNLTPDVVICDEIGDRSELSAINDCLRLGAAVILTAHADSREDIMNRKALLDMIRISNVKKIIFLEGPERAGKIKETVNRDELIC
ncbi:MAG: Flp pilus assembly complex ATPase component TadA [Clostridia bacterium]|nr:Flp pilus assembly complex ATPase component TadA [Clostridia bacterium]